MRTTTIRRALTLVTSAALLASLTVATVAAPTAAARPAGEADLLARAFFLECTRWRQQDQPFVFGAEAAIRCVNPDSRVRQLALFTFPTQRKLDDYWIEKMDSIGLPPAEASSACEATGGGGRIWDAGEIACYVRGGRARIRWTDERTGMYALLDAADGDMETLYGWWRSKGRRLGRPLDEAPGRPGPATAPTAQPVGDGPGQPSAFVCDGVTRIEDPLGRRWLVTSVQFLNRRGSERVIYKMELNDDESGFSASTVAADAFPMGDPDERLGKLEKPNAGDSIVRVTMGNEVNDATRLQHYQPKGVQVVKDLSISRLDDGTTVSLIGVTGEGCHRVRVPAWESPSGDQATAEIILDIQP
jgi:hypothetical protein